MLGSNCVNAVLTLSGSKIVSATSLNVVLKNHECLVSSLFEKEHSVFT